MNYILTISMLSVSIMLIAKAIWNLRNEIRETNVRITQLEYKCNKKYSNGCEDSIKCPQCGFVSYNDNDIKFKFCSKCHEWHEYMVKE